MSEEKITEFYFDGRLVIKDGNGIAFDGPSPYKEPPAIILDIQPQEDQRIQLIQSPPKE